jgi:hypothetical protein
MLCSIIEYPLQTFNDATWCQWSVRKRIKKRRTFHFGVLDNLFWYQSDAFWNNVFFKKKKNMFNVELQPTHNKSDGYGWISMGIKHVSRWVRFYTINLLHVKYLFAKGKRIETKFWCIFISYFITAVQAVVPKGTKAGYHGAAQTMVSKIL